MSDRIASPEEQQKYKRGTLVLARFSDNVGVQAGWYEAIVQNTQQTNVMVEMVSSPKAWERVNYDSIQLPGEKKVLNLAELAEMSMKYPVPEEDKGYYPHPSAVSGLPRGPVTHRLKAHPDTMRLLRQGEITSNIRKHDRDYRKGDRIVFQEYTPTPTCIENKGRWSSATFTAIITHVQGDNCDGLATGFCVLSLAFKLGECLGHDFNYAGKYDPR